MAIRLTLAPPADSTPTVTGTPILGPNTKLAMLRALAVKATRWASTAGETITYTVRTATRLPGWVGHMTLSVLSTPAGYTTTVHLIHKTIKGLAGLLDRSLVAAGTLTATATGAAVGLIAQLLPGLGANLVSGHADAIDTVISHYTKLRTTLAAFGDDLVQRAHSPLVKYAATRSAGAASAALIIHILTQGVLASKALHVAPALASSIVFLTNPWGLLAAVTGITTFTLLWSRFTNTELSLDETGEIQVTVTPDGSVTVHGTPDGLSEQQRHNLNDQILTETIKTMEAATHPRPKTSRATRKVRKTA